MPEQAVLPAATQERIASLGAVDIVVGIPSYNNADTIAHVVRAAQSGLHVHFAGYRGLIVNSDGGSIDGTPEKVLDLPGEPEELLQLPYRVDPVERLSTPYHGVPGRASAIRTIFEIARATQAKACVLFDSDLQGVVPDWVKALVAPVIEDRADFVAAWHTRRKFDGTITSGILYPLTRALYGKRIRQPFGGELAVSPAYVERALTQSVWNSDLSRDGFDVWLTDFALVGGFRLAQARLGPREQQAREPGSDLAATLVQVLAPVFLEIERHVATWQKIRGSEAVPAFGSAPALSAETAEVDTAKMIEAFRFGQQNLQDVWGLVLTPATMVEMKKIARAAEMRMPDDVWARTVYDFALGYRLRVIARDHLLRAMTPLYLGWVASFVQETRQLGPEATEARIEKLCLAFEQLKPYLISRWRWPDRFNP
ncbi:MAG: glycosyltransferase [Bryobacterales bacterium]|nr:glycosyltransferase [Bryobacterales bacterium]